MSAQAIHRTLLIDEPTANCLAPQYTHTKTCPLELVNPFTHQIQEANILKNFQKRNALRDENW